MNVWRRRRGQSNCAVSRNVTGAFTWETLPGRKRQRRKLRMAASSREEFPVLFHIETWVTYPLLRSIVMTAIPSPVIPFCRAAAGYSGDGALRASAIADGELAERDVPLRILVMDLLIFWRTEGGLFVTSVKRFSSMGVGAGNGLSISGGGDKSSAAEADSIKTSTVWEASPTNVSFDS